MNTESIELLKECNSGCKNATNSMEQLIPYIKEESLLNLVKDYNARHARIGEECCKILYEEGKDEKDPNKVTQAMAWFGTGVKLMFDDDSAKISDILIDGCNMGIKSVSKYINKYKGAENEAKNPAMELVSIEQDFMNELLAYL